MFNEYKNLLRLSQENLNMIDQFIKILDNPALSQANKELEFVKLAPQLLALENETKAAGQRMNEAQKTFARDYNITLIYPK
jgi:hypothetical protein